MHSHSNTYKNWIYNLIWNKLLVEVDKLCTSRDKTNLIQSKILFSGTYRILRASLINTFYLFLFGGLKQAFCFSSDKNQNVPSALLNSYQFIKGHVNLSTNVYPSQTISPSTQTSEVMWGRFFVSLRRQLKTTGPGQAVPVQRTRFLSSASSCGIS